ncbi:transposase Tn5 [Nostoc flagelliforme CCNUN1]|uniref:Transposase Tn5 n=1 Tax=Nostoc flagelliforme CCNUN1 TaxID=2038116 RepID=A0A2K8SZY6_9NOSO|nr:transposase Tn5 [Nostoc flagelliforme CCNUN1]
MKKEGYGPIGKGGNGLILYSALAIEPEKGQSIGLLWQKLWNREPKQKLPKDETPTQKKHKKSPITQISLTTMLEHRFTNKTRG